MSFKYLLFNDWLKDFQNNIVVNMMLIGFLQYRGMDVSSMFDTRKTVSEPLCTSRMPYTEKRHHRADHLHSSKDYSWIEKDYSLERLFTAWKRLFTAVGQFLQNSEFIFDHMTHLTLIYPTPWILFLLARWDIQFLTLTSWA